MKYIILSIVIMVGCAGNAQPDLNPSRIEIDSNFPGGNVTWLGTDGNTVRLQHELRDTSGDWFYWSFKVRGAQERTLDFVFTGDVIGARGPAVSSDGGITWRWLSNSPDFSWNTFQYTFGPEEKEVLFGMGMNYTQKDLERFFDKYKGNPNLRIETLCKSGKGRDVELLRIPGKGNGAEFKVVLTSRHHCCEMMATYALEGIIETALSDSEDGRWLREHCDFFIVPFVDKDGVEDGDQGKNRKPWDHNRDYIQLIYPETKAITEQVPAWQNGKPLFLYDLHCPWLRTGADGNAPDKGTNEYLYQVGRETEKVWIEQQRFGRILEAEKKGTIPYKASFDLPYGKAWNTPTNFTQDGVELMSSTKWAQTLPGVIFSSSIEVPYANASGTVVDTSSARALGRDLARAMRVYMETVER